MTNITKADELIPGNRVLIDGWANEVVKVRVEEIDAPGQRDRYMITFRTEGLNGTPDDRETRCTASRRFTPASA